MNDNYVFHFDLFNKLDQSDQLPLVGLLFHLKYNNLDNEIKAVL